jgi:predicted Zn-dependent peptidase
MKNSFRTMLHALMVLAAFVFVGCTADKYSYETVPNDPLKARIYTLDNGLKVYMSVNEEEPRIQTYIAVRVGGKNDPAETTGLAHYFEHLMFKGTEKFGTQNFEQEKPLLDEIEKQFEVYRKTTDDAERKAIYKVIDSLSYEASKISIPNEYDKLMSAIGANGTNAYTSYDVTCYTEDIPSNQIENWAKIQADRFQNATIRGFHTELETVYEEKNMSLTNDTRKVLEKINSVLFPNHPYGTQTVLGTQEHLKNPSITNIKNYHKTWYVPNNMAICLSGDFNPDEMIAIIDKYFGQMQPNPNLPKLEFPEEKPITEPIVAEVVGLEAERIFLSWRFPGAAHPDGEKLELLSQILFNGTAGLFDLNLIQQQKVLYGLCTPFTMADYSAFIMYGGPKQGQTLEEVKDLFFAELKTVVIHKVKYEISISNCSTLRIKVLGEQARNKLRLPQGYRERFSPLRLPTSRTSLLRVYYMARCIRAEVTLKLISKIVRKCSSYSTSVLSQSTKSVVEFISRTYRSYIKMRVTCLSQLPRRRNSDFCCRNSRYNYV